MFAVQMGRQRAAERATGALGVNAPEFMDFRDDAVLDPTQVEDRRTGDEQGLYGLFGPPAGGGGGGAWGEGVGGGGGGAWGYAPPVQQVGEYGGLTPQGLLGSFGGGMGVGAAPGAPRASGGGGFSAAPSGPDFRGPDFNPSNLREWQGLLGVPQAIRTLATAEKQLGLPGLSDAVTGVGFRSREQQAAARARYLAGQGALAAPPGSSFHEQGEAFDISSSWLSANPTARPWLEKHGFTWDVGGEPWHAHYVGGGQPLRPATGNQNRPITAERRGGGPTSQRRSAASPLAAYRRR